jgi:hypothetical protein
MGSFIPIAVRSTRTASRTFPVYVCYNDKTLNFQAPRLILTYIVKQAWFWMKETIAQWTNREVNECILLRELLNESN